MMNWPRALSEGVRTATRQGRLVIPLAIAELCAILLAMAPRLFVSARILAAVHALAQPTSAAGALAGVLDAAADPSTWVIVALGAAAALAGAFLVRTVVEAGALGPVAEQLGRAAPVEPDAFLPSVLGHTARYLATRTLAMLLELFALVCIGGAVVSGMRMMRTTPGVGAAFAMTLATLSVLALPFTLAALEVGFARSVLLGESPVAALAGGFAIAVKRWEALVPAWAAYAIADGAVVFALVVADIAIAAAAPGSAAGLLLLLPVAAALFAFAYARGAVSLARLATLAAFVGEDEGTYPPAPEPVFQAVAVA